VKRLSGSFKTLLDWPRTSQLRALDNARAATTECCRRRIEREEVIAALRLLAVDVRVDVQAVSREARG